MSWKVIVKPILDKRYFMTHKGDLNQDAFLNKLQTSLERGYLFFRFRKFGFDDHTYAKWAKEVVALAKKYHACVMVDSVSVLEDTQAHGLHAPQDLLLTFEARPVSPDYLFAASIHDLHTCAWANHVQTDFVTLSAVKPTPSHPGVMPIGWEGFQTIAQHSACPVYALGGVELADLPIAEQHGAYGIAAIRAMWG